MITKDNLYKVLEHYGFTKDSPTKYSKSFGGTTGNVVIVDFQNEKISYPEGLDTGDNTTTNFSHNENFVVLECVIRLLNQGYKPDTIFLEKAWTLGHTAKSGRADITVFKNFAKDDDENATEKILPYLIIECKTAGKEYKEAQKDLYDDPDGKQLFSYFCQARSVEWLQLYASDLDSNDNIVMYEEVIKTIDDDNVLDAYKLDDTIQTFKNASEAKDAFLAWEDTYAKESWKNRGLIFGDDAQAYNIGIKPKKRKDLIDLKDKDDTKGVVDKFREILRHNSVSDKENAFNKLLSLFICKFVDEDTHQNDNDVMDFQYVEGTDNYYSLYEKLLNLFNKGMDEYLKEKVFYLGQDYIGKTLQQYAKKKRKNLQEELEISFQKTKMLSCQVFAFKEVYNEKLFAQNGKILVEMVKLLQDYSFSGTGDKQLLGDLFENLLNQGFKQEAGQFFTPIPITRFIWNSLPIEKYIRENGYKIPKTIDFACGSGHFLTEGISAVKDAFKTLGLEKTDADISAEFYGTEKDNRLARVSKVALLFNGATKAKIFAVDGLEHQESDLGRLNSFDILVANPPYSVDEFKKHVSRKVQKSYETIQLMSTQCGDIQNVFSERMQYLLNSKGLASIILPSSYLNTKNEADILTRDLLVKNFYIKAIANFNDKTFGETNTTTVILFLERRNLDVKEAKISQDSVDAILNLEDLAGWVDEEIFNEYLSAINTEKDVYNTFWTEKNNVLEADKFAGYFKEYRDYYVQRNAKDLEKIESVRQLEADGKLKKNQKTSAELIDAFNKSFYKYVKQTEQDKILILSLTYNQQTLILNAPKDNTEQEKFLGYTFSKRRGGEGINETEGFLSNKTNRNDSDKIAYIFKQVLSGEAFNNDKYGKYISMVKTSDMINFVNPVFDKTIKSNIDKKVEVKYKWPLEKIGKVCNCFAGGDKPQMFSEYPTDTFCIPIYANGVDNKGLVGYTTQAKCFNECVTVSARGTIGYCEIRKTPFVPIVRLIVAEPNDGLKALYLKEFINSISFDNTGGAIPQLTVPDFKEFTIPLPPLDIQAQIVSECEAIDNEFENSKKNIEESKAKIEEIMSNVEGEKKRLKDICDMKAGKFVPAKDIFDKDEEGLYPCYGGNGLRGYTKSFTHKGLYPIVGRQGALCGNVHLVEGVFHATEHAVPVAPNNGINVKWLYYALKSLNLNQYATGTAQPGLSVTKVLEVECLVPSLPEQERIVKLVEAEEKKINDAKAVMASAKERKQAVLDKYLK